MSNSSIGPIERILSGTTTPSQSGPGSNGHKGALHIPHSFKAGTLPLDFLLCQNQETHGKGSYPSAEMQLVYSTVPANKAWHLLRR